MSVIVWIFVYLLVESLFGSFSYFLAMHKGYKGYFWLGFVFGMLGFLYVGFLPCCTSENSQKERKSATLKAMYKTLMESEKDTDRDR